MFVNIRNNYTEFLLFVNDERDSHCNGFLCIIHIEYAVVSKIDLVAGRRRKNVAETFKWFMES